MKSPKAIPSKVKEECEAKKPKIIETDISDMGKIYKIVKAGMGCKPGDITDGGAKCGYFISHHTAKDWVRYEFATPEEKARHERDRKPEPPVIEEPKPFVEGQPIMWCSQIYTVLKYDSGDNTYKINFGDGYWVPPRQLRHLTAPERAEWDKKQEAKKPKTPVYEEGDVVWSGYAGRIVTLKHKIPYTDVWDVVETELGIPIESIRNLTEKEWINEVEGVKFKAYYDKDGNLRLCDCDTSILSHIQVWLILRDGGFEFQVAKALIKNAKVKVMPYSQWKRMSEEKK